MQVIVEGTKIRLNQADQLGAGGEGTVFKSRLKDDDLAIKVYHQPTRARAKKLQEFLSTTWELPENKIARPLHLVYDQLGQSIIGLTMPMFGRGFEELASLSNRKTRASLLINTKRVAEIFTDGWGTLKTIHENGLVIGDFNDLNALFRANEMLFIDVDAWQFNQFPCPVATEQFLAPELYGIDLSKGPVFKPQHDWYSYSVLLFRSLLLVHPYGGTHKDYHGIINRARARLTVFNKEVTYPQIALTPDILNDDLANTFEKFFAKGWRGDFPLAILQQYLLSLVNCKSCNTYYPSTRKQCPVCNAKTIMVIIQETVTKGVVVSEFIRTDGPIVFHKILGSNVFAIAYEEGKAYLYSKIGSLPSTKRELFDEIPGARYDLVGDFLIVNQPNTTNLTILDIGGSKTKKIQSTQTSVFAPNRKAIFRASNKYLFRLISGNLLFGEIKDGRLIERLARPVMTDQTWFAVKMKDEPKPTACGFFQVLNKQMFWLLWEGRSYDNLEISQLEPDESLIDLSVRFSSNSVVIRRLTQQKGKNYYRTDVLDDKGKVIATSPQIKVSEHMAPYLHGQAFGNGKLLTATDEGIIQEDLFTGSIKTFDTTKRYVSEGDSVSAFQDGLLIVGSQKIVHLKLGQ